METIKFKGDSATRRRFFTPDSFQHPAKMASGLVLECIERYSKPGDLVLDPMAGSGTLLLGAMYGRNLILNELELHFLLPMVASWRKIQQNGPALGHEMGRVVILRGDARCLPLPDASVGAAITSPPYEATDITKPLNGTTQGNATHKGGLQRRYTRPVDAIVTSPSYEGTRIGRSGSLGEVPFGGPNSQARGVAYAPGNATNIGNLRNAAYWEAMRQVYAECWRVLKPGGIMALVLKGYTRDGQYVDLPGQTESMLLEAGWLKHDEWKRELYSLSFWRILQRRRSPEAFDNHLWFEEVLAFRKPPEGIDA